MLIGTSIIIAAIECDLGNYVKRTQNVESLGTFAGIVDGIASCGSILSQKTVIAIKNGHGWRGAFYVMGTMLAIATLPAARFFCFERQIRK